jgi:Zn-dependent protease with chaperone function
MRYIPFFLLLFGLVASKPSVAEVLSVGISSYKRSFDEDARIKDPSGEFTVIKKEYLNAFLKAKKDIEKAADLDPFDWGIAKEEKLQASMFDNGIRGYLHISSGAFEILKDDTALYAALVGHEAAHYLLKHRESRHSLNTGLGVLFAVALSASTQNTYPNTFEIGNAGGKILSNPFTRSHELEADKFGMQLLKNGGYDPMSMRRLLEKLSSIGETTGLLDYFFKTHPYPSERIKTLYPPIEQGER